LLQNCTRQIRIALAKFGQWVDISTFIYGKKVNVKIIFESGLDLYRVMMLIEKVTDLYAE
jgi:hypothetical protein